MVALCGPAFGFAGDAAAGGFSVIHDFSGSGADGGLPSFTLAINGRGALYGTTFMGGASSYGTVFELRQADSAWKLAPIYNFQAGEGESAWGLTRSHGSIYINTSWAEAGGGSCGAAVKLGKPVAGLKHLRQATDLHTFVYSAEGCDSGNVIFDPAGNMFGVTQIGGANGWGAVYELSPSDAGWTETTLYSFKGALDGGTPMTGLIRDAKGNLYGTAAGCTPGMCSGTAFELRKTQSGWKYSVLHVFNDKDPAGAQPVAGLIRDKQGNLYGATSSLGANGGGTVFELSPAADGRWTISTLYNFSGTHGPAAPLSMDEAGNLYGTTFMDGAEGDGSVFKLTKGDGGWSYTDLHDFTGGADGGWPGGGVTLDAQGNLFGTASSGGAYGWGVAWEITQ